MRNNTTQNLSNYDTPQNVGEHPHDKTGTIGEIKIIKVDPVTIINTQTEKTWPGLRVKKKKNRCRVCNKKVGLLGFSCKCSSTSIFCSLHRLPEDHQCIHDHRSDALNNLSDKLVRVVASKVNPI